jgi:hypothetical protein
MGGRLEKEDVAEAKKDILWRKYIYNPHAKEFVAEIEKENIRILEVAIKVCESKSASSSNAQSISHSFGLSLPEAEKALEVIKRISIFHAEGKAINEFHDLLRICKENPGAMPLAEPFEEQYVHEAIHVILTKNGIYAYGPLNPGLSRAFDEGLCAYLHIRLRGKLRTFGQYFRHEYQMYIPFFKNLLDTVSHQNVGGYVKLHFGQIMRNLHNFLSTGNIYERIPT